MLWKIKVFGLRLWEFILRWPYRLIQFFAWLLLIHRPHGKHIFLRWISGLFFKAIDLSPIPLFLETILDILKWKTRPINEAEQKEAERVFGSSINLALIGMDANSWPVKQRKAQAYVSLHTINFLDTLSNPILIHECVHLWQYKKHGSLYISEAIYAQRWGGGYDYGGITALEKHKDEGLMAFNFEQQAEIVEDAYKSVGDSGVYQKYLAEIKGSEVLHA